MVSRPAQVIEMPSPWAVLRNAQTPIEAETPTPWAPVPEEPMQQSDTKQARVINHFGEGPGKAIPPVLQSRLDEPIPADQNIANTQEQLQKVRYAQTHPWGTPENHPGKLGKLAHVFSEVGNVAGNIVAPNVMERIPETQLGMKADEGRLAKRLDTEEEKRSLENEQAATTAKTNAETPEVAPNAEALRNYQGAETRHANVESEQAEQNLANGPDLAHGYAHAVNDAIKRGVDPAQDPVVQHLADAITGIQPNKNSAEKIAPHITTVQSDGKPHIMERDPQTGQYSIDRGVAPPNYAQVLPQVLASKTAQITNADTGLPELRQYDVHSQTYDKPLGTPGTGTYAHQIQSATAAERMVNNSLLPLISKMEKTGELGPIQGRFSDFLNRDIGNAPPDVAQLHQLMNGVVSMMMGMYGFRRQQAVDQLSAQMGARMTPESMRAALQGIVQHAQSIQGGAVNPQAGGQVPQMNNAPPPGAKIIRFEDIK